MTQPRDPEGRRHAIAAAAADLLIDAPTGRLTHRQVAQRAGVPLGSTTYYFHSLDELIAAAVELLAERVEADLADTAEEIRRTELAPAALADLLADYLDDADRVNTETALYVAAVQRPELRQLSRRYFDGLIEILQEFIDTRTATAFAVFVDGAILHAALHNRPLDRADLARVATLLLTGATEAPDPTPSQTPGKES